MTRETRPGLPLSPEPGRRALIRATGALLTAGWVRSVAATGAAPPAALPPDSIRLLYDITGNASRIRYQASGTLTWERQVSHYDLQMRISAFLVGARTQRSTGRLDASGLVPERFLDITRREREVLFDHERSQISYSEHDRQDPLEPGAQDRLSLLFQLGAQFNARTPRPGQRIAMPVVSTSKSERWTFEVIGREAVNLPAGTHQSWHVQRAIRDTDDTRLSVWLAPDLQHLPVRLVLHYPNGDQVEQLLRRRP